MYDRYLFNLYSEATIREIAVLTRFSNGGHNPNNVRLVHDTFFMADTREKLHNLIDKVVKDSVKK